MNSVEKEIGRVYKTNQSGDCMVIGGSTTKNLAVRFPKTGYETVVDLSHLRNGQVLDPFTRTVAGVGFFGEGDFKKGSEETKRPYHIWNAMMQRCYNLNNAYFKTYGKKGVRVAPEWHNFQIFARWFVDHHVENGHLDKDILGDGKLYGPCTCCLVPDSINYVVRKGRKSSNGMASGVCKSKHGHKFYARSVMGGGCNRNLGCFDSMHEAFVTYKEHKELVIKELAEKEYRKGAINHSVYSALMEWSVTPY